MDIKQDLYNGLSAGCLAGSVIAIKYFIHKIEQLENYNVEEFLSRLNQYIVNVAQMSYVELRE
jgi:hypothetical protein